MENKDVVKYWDKGSRWYLDIWGNSLAQEYVSSLELDFIEKYVRRINKGGVIHCLDIGIGYGRILRKIASFLGGNGDYYGVELSKDMIAAFRRNCPDLKVNILNRSFADITPKEGWGGGVKFDFITCIRVLKYDNRYDEWFRNFSEFLSEDGVLILSVTNKHSIAFFDKLSVAHYKLSKDELEDYLGKYGLETVEIAGFQMLPEIIYRLFNSKSYLRGVLFAERLLGYVFPGTFLKRVLYVAIQKKRFKEGT